MGLSAATAILGGDFSRLASFFDANIFHPLPLTLAYSEHFIAQAVQILPIWALTGNPILCYNLLYLSTFVLSGLGAYLFVRELSGDPRAAFVAGVLFAFAPYRFPQSSHLQVLSSQWMPFALYGFRRFFDSIDAPAVSRGGRWRPLLGAAAALVAQNLSCTYYLMFFAPFVIAYVVWEIWRRRLWSRTRLWMQLVAAAVVVAALTLPVLLPYAMVQDQLQIARSRGELSMYAADVYSYATAVREQILWGSIARVFPKAEGDLFPGLVAVFLALVGVATWRRDAELNAPPVTKLAWATTRHLGDPSRHRRRNTALSPLHARHRALHYSRDEHRSAPAQSGRSGRAGGSRLPGLPQPHRRVHATRGFFVLALVAAMWLSLGLAPQTLGRPLNLTGLYQLLYSYIPGFDGLRVPARFNMIAVLMLAVLGGYGAGGAVALAMVLAGTRDPHHGVLRREPRPSVPDQRARHATRLHARPRRGCTRPARAPAVYHRLAQESGCACSPSCRSVSPTTTSARCSTPSFIVRVCSTATAASSRRTTDCWR